MMVINSCYDLSCPHFKTNYTCTCGDEGVGTNARNSQVILFGSNLHHKFMWRKDKKNLNMLDDKIEPVTFAASLT